MDKNTSNTSDPQGQEPNGTEPQGQEPTDTTNSTPQTGKRTSDDYEREITELRRENAARRKKERDAAEAAQQAEAARLKEQGEYKQLAEKHESRVKELEPIQEAYTRLSALVSTQVEAQIKDWPKEVRTFDPGTDAPIEQRLEWLEKSKPLVEKLATQARGQQPGNSPNPQPAGPSLDSERDRFLKRLSASGKYSS